MRARHRDGGFQSHQFGEHFRAAHHRDAGFQCGGDFGVGAAHGGGGNHHRHAFDVLCLVADVHGDPARAQPLNARAFRDVAIISGLVERQQPGRRKSGRAMTVSTDLIYDVLQRHDPGHLLLDAAWTEASARLTDLDRLKRLIARAESQLLVRHLDRVSPLAVPVLIEIGREGVSHATDEALLAELAAPTAPA